MFEFLTSEDLEAVIMCINQSMSHDEFYKYIHENDQKNNYC
jgi:hypothetical protein